MNGPVINIPAYDPKVAGHRYRPNLRGSLDTAACHVAVEVMRVEPFGPNEVIVSIDGVRRIVDAFALNRALNESIQLARKLAL